MTVYVYSRTQNEATAFRNGWRRVFGKVVGAIYLFPSEATAFIAQWYPEIRFTCKLPAKTREISVAYISGRHKLHNVAFPELVLSQYLSYDSGSFHGKLCDCSHCSGKKHPGLCHCHLCHTLKKCSKAKLKQEFYLYYPQNNVGGQGRARDVNIPYKNVNVHSDARICIGNQRPAKSLRQANTNFWGSPFNNDFGTQIIEHRYCKLAIHSHRGCHRNQFVKSCRRYIEHSCGCPEKHQNLHEYPCPCDSGDCLCICSCDCCINKCKCTCNCNCCKKVCECRCDCDLTYQFASAISKYRPSSSALGSVSNQFFLGKKYIATTKKMAGVFVSYCANFLNTIPQHLHETDAKGSKLVIGFARINNDGQWEILTKTSEKFIVYDREVKLL